MGDFLRQIQQRAKCPSRLMKVFEDCYRSTLRTVIKKWETEPFM